MRLWSGARGQIERKANAVTEAVGETTARAVRRDAVVAGRVLGRDLSELGGPLTRAALTGVLAVQGLNLASKAAVDLLSRALPRWAAGVTVAAVTLGLGAAIWRWPSGGLLSRTSAWLSRDLDHLPETP